jgi:hypothetical protein
LPAHTRYAFLDHVTFCLAARITLRFAALQLKQVKMTEVLCVLGVLGAKSGKI